MTYPFVASFARYGSLAVAPRAFVIHMAEGGGTVGYLSRANARGVSVHYVVERTGRVVQMLREHEASGSINPRDIRTTDDPTFADPTGLPVTYGRTAARLALRDRGDNPNSAVLSCEVEGFAREGPNPAQHRALVALVADIRSRHRGLPLLGHRDFADYKACPGRLVRWGELGGHAATGNTTGGDADMKLLWGNDDPKLATIDAGVQLYDPDLTPAVKVSVKQVDRPSPFGVTSPDGTRYRFVRVTTGGEDRALLVKSSQADLVSVATGDSGPAVAAALEKARTAAVSAVGLAIDGIAQEVI